MLGRNFHIQVVFAAVDVPVLDLTVRELHAPVPVRQVVFVGPLLDFAGVAIGPSVRVRPAAVALMPPLLVFPLQLLLQAHALKLHPLRLELGGVTLVRAVDLAIVFELAFPGDACVKRLPAVGVAVSIGFQKIPAAVGRDHRLFAIAGDADGLDEALFAEVPEFAVARISGPIVTVSEVARWHNAKRANGCQ
jgi:hypothetical protein